MGDKKKEKPNLFERTTKNLGKDGGGDKPQKRLFETVDEADFGAKDSCNEQPQNALEWPFVKKFPKNEVPWHEDVGENDGADEMEEVLVEIKSAGPIRIKKDADHTASVSKSELQVDREEEKHAFERTEIERPAREKCPQEKEDEKHAESVDKAIPSATVRTEGQLPKAEMSEKRMISSAHRAGGKNTRQISFENVNFSYSAEGKLLAMGPEATVCLGNFALRILEEKRIITEIINEANEVTGHDEEEKWKIEIVQKEKSFKGWISHDKIWQFSWIQNVSNGWAIWDERIEVKRLLKIYINRLIMEGDYKTVVEYTIPGWKWFDNGTICYLTADGPIGYVGSNLKADDKFRLLTKSESKVETIQKYLDMRRIIPGNEGNAVLLQCYSLMSLLTSLYKKSGTQIEFSVALIGRSNSKKTTCGEIFTRIFGRTKSAVPDINFSSTEAAIYEVMDKKADQMVMIDDLTPSDNSSTAKEKARKLEAVVRAYGDRVPRRRSTSFSASKNVKEFVPINGCALLTGEVFPGGKSSRSRVVVLRFESGDVDDGVLYQYQQELSVLPNFAKLFLEYVTPRVAEIMQVIAVEHETARRQMKGQLQLPRFVDAYACFCGITRIFSDFLVDENFLDRQCAENLLLCDREYMFDIIRQNDDEVSVISPAILIVQALKEGLEKGRIQKRFVSEICAKGNACFENTLIELEDVYAIRSADLWQCAREYADFHRIYFPYNSGKSIIGVLKEEDLLSIKKEGKEHRAAQKIVANGDTLNPRFLCLLKEKVRKIWDEME